MDTELERFSLALRMRYSLALTLGMDTEERNREGFRAELPPDIWEEIGNRLPTRCDAAHFRSVCKTWRSSLPSPTRFPLQLPRPGWSSDFTGEEMGMPSGGAYFITQHGFYAVDTRSSEANRMFVLVDRIDQSGGKFQPFAFQPAANLAKQKVKIPQICRFSFLSKLYTLRMVLPGEGEWRPVLAVMRTVLIYSDSGTEREVAVVARVKTGCLSLLRLRDGGLSLNWETDLCNILSKDIISYNGKLFAVDQWGGAFVMDYDSLQMTRVAAPLFAESDPDRLVIKLVEAPGQLHLVVSSPNPNFEYDVKVYVLRSELEQWHEVKDLGDQVFIRCENHCFSVARDLFADVELVKLTYPGGLLQKRRLDPNSKFDFKSFYYHSSNRGATATARCVVPSSNSK